MRSRNKLLDNLPWSMVLPIVAGVFVLSFALAYKILTGPAGMVAGVEAERPNWGNYVSSVTGEVAPARQPSFWEKLRQRLQEIFSGRTNFNSLTPRPTGSVPTRRPTGSGLRPSPSGVQNRMSRQDDLERDLRTTEDDGDETDFQNLQNQENEL